MHTSAKFKGGGENQNEARLCDHYDNHDVHLNEWNLLTVCAVTLLRQIIHLNCGKERNDDLKSHGKGDTTKR